MACVTYFLMSGSKKAMIQFHKVLGMISKNKTARHTRKDKQGKIKGKLHLLLSSTQWKKAKTGNVRIILMVTCAYHIDCNLCVSY